MTNQDRQARAERLWQQMVDEATLLPHAGSSGWYCIRKIDFVATIRDTERAVWREAADYLDHVASLAQSGQIAACLLAHVRQRAEEG